VKLKTLLKKADLPPTCLLLYAKGGVLSREKTGDRKERGRVEAG